MSYRSQIRADSAQRRGVELLDPLWSQIRREAEGIIARESEMASLIVSVILNHETLESAISHRIAGRLAHPALPADLISQAFREAISHDPTIAEAMRADILAVADRDPACTRMIEPVLYFKGFHAIETHRLAHWLWHEERRDFALYLQSRSSEVFQTDINPAARIGKGIFLDHATGLVIGATAVVEDNVSMLQDVTLGGTGKEQGDRHPKIRHGVLIGAGAKILGNIEVGHCARVAAGSVVLQPVPPNTTVAGVPARVVGTAGCAEPARRMDQILADKGTD
ncbi:MAG: serine O-acetyltransferase [Chelatococcus sp.]|uniref:serine O-acetyltransferase n=1 Tax=unclassified Chelatococcus TaxID=2638111 RepID=UPI001BCD4E8D|nr:MULTISPECIES: serine O-acetyltransferase [unclassified Chelatococcus]CAH1668593.1 serine acetyltransferase [Hyphomicrobiales bacterium]MBS7738096.1 serine O-acetyltransferase [Chelatococcus sp. HY11]MBX3536024.1 serine O-acetyltransferase [Chelatococcus sp.]MBX3546957.1 serine O-acetyltransferase [Chelatococcus sp.]MCO5077558.1 serine O-acetyltransferase [Chelatococcus sp.]